MALHYLHGNRNLIQNSDIDLPNIGLNAIFVGVKVLKNVFTSLQESSSNLDFFFSKITVTFDCRRIEK